MRRDQKARLSLCENTLHGKQPLRRLLCAPITQSVSLTRNKRALAAALGLTLLAAGVLGVLRWRSASTPKSPIERARTALVAAHAAAIVQLSQRDLVALVAPPDADGLEAATSGSASRTSGSSDSGSSESGNSDSGHSASGSSGARGPEASLRHLAGAFLRELGVEETLQHSPALADGAQQILWGVVPSATGVDPKGVYMQGVYFGRFDTSAIEAQFYAAVGQSGWSLRSERGGDRVFEWRRRDPESCEERASYLAVSARRVVLSHAGPIEALLDALGPAPVVEADTPESDAPLLAFDWRPVALSDTHPRDTWNGPLARMHENASRGPVETAQLRIEPAQLLRDPTLVAALELDSEERAETWRSELAAILPDPPDAWATLYPALASLTQALELTRTGNRLEVRLPLESDRAASLGAALFEAVTWASTLPASPRTRDSDAVTDAIEAWPTRFLNELSLHGLRPYGDARGRMLPVDRTSGPFGVRIESVSSSAEAGALEIDLRAFGRTIPNLVEPRDSPRLVIDRIADANGDELRVAAACGPDRPELPTPLRTEILSARSSAERRLRLRPGTRLSDVQSIEGHIALELPLLATRLIASDPMPGDTTTSEGARFELTSVGSDSFTFRIPRDGPRLIAIRALNDERQPLEERASWDWADPELPMQLGARQYASRVRHVEAIFSLRDRSLHYAFSLDSALPGTQGRADQVESSQFVQYSGDQFDREFGDVSGDRWIPPDPPLAKAIAGPFAVLVATRSRPLSDSERTALDLPDARPALAPRVWLLAPKLPNLTYHATALELVLREPQGEVGRSTSEALEWHAWVHPRHRFGKPNLEARIDLRPSTDRLPSSLGRLRGELTLRLPKRVETLSLSELEPGTAVRSQLGEITLVALGRDSMTLELRGPIEHFFSARPFTESGEELAAEVVEMSPLADRTDAGGPPVHLIQLRVRGRASRLEIQLGTDADTRSYPIDLDFGLTELAPEGPGPEPNGPR